MPYDEVMHKWKTGQLHSGSKTGPKVTNQKQAVAIMLSEKRKAEEGKKEYKPVKKYQDGGSVEDDMRNAPPVYDKLPTSPNIQDRRVGPPIPSNIPHEMSLGVTYDVGSHRWKPSPVSPQGKAWAAKNLPKELPTTPIAQKKGGPVVKSSWRRW